MSKTRIFAITMLILIGAAIFTNPKKEEFDSIVKNKATELVKKELNYEHQDALELGMTLFGNKMVDDFVEKNVIVDNYYLFSTVSINWQGQKTPIGGGVFKTIWLSPKIDEKADEIISILKKL